MAEGLWMSFTPVLAIREGRIGWRKRARMLCGSILTADLWIPRGRRAKYSDEEIAQMIAERKPLPEDYRSRVQLRDKRGYKERELDVVGENKTQYCLILRQSNFNTLDFSIILAVNPLDSNQLFRLRRYNGKSHERTNQIEGDTFYDFHIHQATERYQESGAREDTFAESTGRYADFHSALRCLLEDCGFEAPQNTQASFFGEFDL
jgi:hypothetical protein